MLVALFIGALPISAHAEASARALNVNFSATADRLSATEEYGVVPYLGAHWNRAERGSTVTLTDSTGATTTATVEGTGRGLEGQGDSFVPLLREVLLDQTWGDAVDPSVTFTNIPFAFYDVYVYHAQNAAGWNTFGPDLLNGSTYYYMPAGATEAVAGTDPLQMTWGDARVAAGYATVLGTNVLKIAGVSGASLTVTGHHVRESNARSNIAAVQVVERRMWTGTVSGDVSAADLVLTWADGNGATARLGELSQASNDVVTLTVERDAVLTLDEATLPLSLTALKIEGPGTLTLDFGRLGLQPNDYVGFPKRMTLFSTVEALPEGLKAQSGALAYGAYAVLEVAQTEVGAWLRVPQGLWTVTAGVDEMINLNFRQGDGGIVSGATLEGLADYAVAGGLWDDFGASSNTPTTVSGATIHTIPSSGRDSLSAVRTEKSNALSYSIANAWYDSNHTNPNALLKQYFDDSNASGGVSPNLSVEIPASWVDGYTAIIYCATDTVGASFSPKCVNGTWYTYENGALTAMTTASTTTPGTTGSWGASNAASTYTEGQNVMVVPNLSGERFELKWYKASNTMRGCVAALSLIPPAPTLSPVGVKTFTATASGNLSWATLGWRDENDQEVGEPGTGDVVSIVLTGDTSLDMSGVGVKGLIVYGNGHQFTVEHRPEGLMWAFVGDTTYRVTQMGEGLPPSETVWQPPKRLRYAYLYAGTYTTTPDYETEFAAGFTGTVTPAGGLVEFSSGTVTFTQMEPSGTDTTFIFSGNSVLKTEAAGTEQESGFHLGTGTAIFRDQAQATVQRLVLTDGDWSRVSNFILEDEATFTVTGRNNDVDSSAVSLLLGHWVGTSTVDLKDNAKLIAERADCRLAHGQNGWSSTSILSLSGNAELRTAGLSANYWSASNLQVNLNGGRLLVGEHGIRPSGERRAVLNFNGGALGAWQDYTLSDSSLSFFSSVTGSPRFTVEPDVTLTQTSVYPLFGTRFSAYGYTPWPSSGWGVAKGATFSASELVQSSDTTVPLQGMVLTVNTLAVCYMSSTNFRDPLYGVLVDAEGKIIAKSNGNRTLYGGGTSFPPRGSGSEMVEFSFPEGVDLQPTARYTLWFVSSLDGLEIGGTVPEEKKSTTNTGDSGIIRSGLDAETGAGSGVAMRMGVVAVRRPEVVVEGKGTVSLQGTSFDLTLPKIQLESSGTLSLAGCTPTFSALSFGEGTTLGLEGTQPVVKALELEGEMTLRVKVGERLTDGGFLRLAEGVAYPDFSQMTAHLALDPERSVEAGLYPQIPLVLGAYDEAQPPTALPQRYAVSNNTHNAIESVSFFYDRALLGQGLYAEITGADVLRQYTVELDDPTDGYQLWQSVASAYPYLFFQGMTDGARLKIPAEGISLPHANFSGQPIRVVAQGATPGVLLTTKDVTVSTQVTFDLSAWEAEMPALVRGAVRGVPVSLCLLSGGVATASGAELRLDLGNYTLPNQYTASLATTLEGVYLVISTETRRAETVSVNFSEAAVPLSGSTVGVYPLPVMAWNDLAGTVSTSYLEKSTRSGCAGAQALAGTLPTVLNATAVSVVADSAQAHTLLKGYLDDGKAQTITVADVPFEAYRVAVLFANDTEGYAYQPVTVNGVAYTMDAAGYTRRNIAGDSAWGSTNRTASDAPVRLGANALVTDVCTASTATIELPVFEYQRRYAGVAAIQIIEAPVAQDSVARTLQATLQAGENVLAEMTNLVDADSGETGLSWENGELANLVLLLPDDVASATVKFPEAFVAQTVSASGAGSLTLTVAEGGSVAVNALDASGLANLTVSFPLIGATFTPPSGTAHFTSLFDNNGQNYTIAAGATLILGETSGIVTNQDDKGTDAATLNINLNGSAGTLRRNYPVEQTANKNNRSVTFAFRNGEVSTSPNTSTVCLLVEDGDELHIRNGFFPNITAANAAWNYTQTGGVAAFESTASNNGGVCFFATGGRVSGATANVSLSGAPGTRLSTYAIRTWSEGVGVNVNVFGAATLALGEAGFHTNAADSTLTATFTEEGTLEFTAESCQGTQTSGTLNPVAFNGGRMTSAVAETACALPIAFGGAADAPTVVAPGPNRTILLTGTNSGSGSVKVESGTLAVASAGAYGEAAIRVENGAAFEARAIAADAALTASVTFADGATCAATTADGALPDSDLTVKIAGSIAFVTNKDTVNFQLNGVPYTNTAITVDEAAGTVTFGAAGKPTLSGVTWDSSAATGIWQHGASGPWAEAKVFANGQSATFNAAPKTSNNSTKVTVSGAVKPSTITFGEGSNDVYTFQAADAASYIDATGWSAGVPVGQGQVFDVPIKTAGYNPVFTGSLATARLIGVFSNGGKTASLVGSGDLNGDGSGAKHAIWNPSGNQGVLTWTPHAGETQILSAHNDHLKGSSQISIVGQREGVSVSGGTVQFGGNLPGNNWNGNFRGSFAVRDGATLDFSMTRANGPDESPLFRNNDDTSLWQNTTAFTLSNSATLRFSGCRGVVGGWNQSGDTSLIQNEAIRVGRNCRLEYTFERDSNAYQYVPHSLAFIGDGATLYIGDASSKPEVQRGLYMVRGSTLRVAGVGDAGDLSDPKTATTEETLPDGTVVPVGSLKEGIEAVIDAQDGTTGLVRWSYGLGDALTSGVTLNVGRDSTLRILANFPVRNEANGGTPFIKTGSGRLSLEYPLIEAQVALKVQQGALGGSATLSNADSRVTMGDGTTIESGLSLSNLAFSGDATLLLDPTGRRALTADSVSFAVGKTYTVSPMGEVPAVQVGQAPIRIMGWRAASAASSVTFLPDAAFAEKGYALVARTDGLYLMREVVYTRELTGAFTAANAATFTWYADQAWERSDAPGVKRNYDPAENEAAAVRFVLPSTYPTSITLLLTKAVTFSKVSFVKRNADDTFTPVAIAVTYSYDLTHETMPAGEASASFTWVPSRTVEGATIVAQISASVPTGYSFLLRDATVVVYHATTEAALNLNFTGRLSGETSWVASDADPCGAVPFAGVYWNNVSTAAGGASVVHQYGAYTLYTTTATVAGLVDDDGQAVSCDIRLATAGATTVSSRRASANDTLAAGYLKGTWSSIPDDILAAGNLDNNECWSGWQLAIDNLPFGDYDLYLLFAGDRDGEVNYPTIRVKTSDSAPWVTYSSVNGWTAPAYVDDSWTGSGSLIQGAFVDGKNLLHLRLSAAAYSTLQIASAESAADAYYGSCGLAALQIVSCSDGTALERVSAGNWSTAGTWSRKLPGDEVRSSAWIDATAEAPRPALITTSSYLTADMVATTPYLRFSGDTSMRFNGSSNLLSVGAVDLRDCTSTFTFESDPFVAPPSVILGKDLTFTLPEPDSPTLNAWRWVCDDRGNGVDTSTALLVKSAPGDLVLTRRVPNRLQIDDGTLWLDTTRDGDYILSSAISGNNGTLGKKGSGTLTLRSAFGLTSAQPLRISEGTLVWELPTTSTLPSGVRILVDGGTLNYQGGGVEQNRTANLPGATISVSNGGTFLIGGNSRLRKSRPTVIVDGGTIANPGPPGGMDDHSHIGALYLRNGATLALSASTDAYEKQGLVLWDDLVVDQGTATLTRSNGDGLALYRENLSENPAIVVESGATLTSSVPISGIILSSGSDNNTPRKFVKRGGGVWIQTAQYTISTAKSFKGVALDLEGGTLRYRLGGGTHGVNESVTSAPLTIKSTARLEGNVAFNARAPIVVEEGGTLAPYLDDNKTSRISIASLSVATGGVLEFDLANTVANGSLIVPSTGTATFGSTLKVRLTNLPSAFTTEKQLTNFGASPTGTPTISCPEAIALDATVEWRTTNGITNLWLVPASATAASYVWSDKTGNWSTSADGDGWTQNGIAAAYPYNVAQADAPAARIQAHAADTSLGVDKGEATTDGTKWLMRGLVLSANDARQITLSEVLNDPSATTLNTLQVTSALWKIGAGTATVSAPILFAAQGTEGSLTLNGGTLRLAYPLQVAAVSTGDSPTVVPASMELASGTTLAFAPGANAPAEQTFSGAIAGSGTLAAEGGTLTLTGSQDSSVNYAVSAGATLRLSGTVASGLTGSARTLTVAAGTDATAAGRAELTQATALGGSDWVLALQAAENDKGAVVATSNGARLRGTVRTTATGTATLGTATAALDGSTTFETPAGTTLKLLGTWSSPSDLTAGTLVKTGPGTLDLQGLFSAGLPLKIREGTLAVSASGQIDLSAVADTSLLPDWTVSNGATLLLSASGRSDFDTGTLILESGATLDLASAPHTLVGACSIAGGSTFLFGAPGSLTLATTAFNSPTEVQGTVRVDLDRLDPATLPTGTTYTLLTFSERTGSGVFQLVGEKQVDWASAGWTLRDTGTAVTLEPFGGTEGTYTWAGTSPDGEGTGNWGAPMWVSSRTSPATREAWPTGDTEKPSVVFQDTDPVDGGQVAVTTVDWNLGGYTLTGLRCDNSALDYTLTASGSSDNTLFLEKDLLKTGSGALTINRKVTLALGGSLKVLGGTATLTGALTSTSGTFTVPLTIGGSGTLRLQSSLSYGLYGLFAGDGTGTLDFASSGTLTIASDLTGLKTLQASVPNGTLTVTAADQTAFAPDVRLAEDALFAFAPKTLSLGGEIDLRVNAAHAEDGSPLAPAGILTWRAGAQSLPSLVPVLSASAAVPADVPALNVQELRYAPASGHLVLNPGHRVLPASAVLTLNDAGTESSAFWLGADTTHGTACDYAGLRGSGLLCVQPTQESQDATWATQRTFTLNLSGSESESARTFSGRLAGALLTDGTAITLGLTVRNSDGAAEQRFTLAGTSTDAYLGTLSIEPGARADVTGTWGSSVKVATGATLGGTGTVGATTRTVRVATDGVLTASAYGARRLANGSISQEIIPGTLSLKGKLTLEENATLRVLVREAADSSVQTSCVEAETVELPFYSSAGDGVAHLKVVVDDEAGLVASNVKILGWESIDGLAAVDATFYDTDGNERTDYLLRKKSDGLYLFRSNARFWMFVR